MRIIQSIAVAAGLACVAVPAAAVTITNGGFEAPDVGGNFVNTVPTGWTVTSGNVEVINNYWQHAGGEQSLDLSGGQAGTISQTLSGFVTGTLYRLSFFMAGNPDAGPSIKRLTASIFGTSETFIFDTTNTSRAAMGWTEMSMTFAAAEGEGTLSFASLENNAFGPALDEVSLNVVPLPAGALLLLSGLGGFALLRRHQTGGTAA